jgi:hypothetical protein
MQAHTRAQGRSKRPNPTTLNNMDDETANSLLAILPVEQAREVCRTVLERAGRPTDDKYIAGVYAMITVDYHDPQCVVGIDCVWECVPDCPLLKEQKRNANES